MDCSAGWRGGSGRGDAMRGVLTDYPGEMARQTARNCGSAKCCYQRRIAIRRMCTCKVKLLGQLAIGVGHLWKMHQVPCKYQGCKYCDWNGAKRNTNDPGREQNTSSHSCTVFVTLVLVLSSRPSDSFMFFHCFHCVILITHPRCLVQDDCEPI